MTWCNEEVGWLAVSSEHPELRDSVRPSHGVHQAVVTNLQLDLLKSAGHGGAGACPLAVDVNYSQSTLKYSR